MSQNYNINMKKFNGTDYDGLLPLAYNALNSQQLDGKTFDEIQELLTRTDLYLYTGSYIGAGTYGYRNPTSIIFPFEPIILIGPVEVDTNYRPINISNYMETSYEERYWLGSFIYLKISEDRKTISWYSSSKANEQLNASNCRYYYAAIGGYDRGFQTEWVITSSGNWTVPKTGKYYIELYGRRGGGSELYGTQRLTVVQGGSSCQSYSNVSLIMRENIPVVIGAGGAGTRAGLSGSTLSSSGKPTSFGNYSVDGGGGTSYSEGTIMRRGKGAGNLGLSGQNVFSSYTPTKGKISPYGCGRGNPDVNGRPRAVYLQYLGE